MALLFRELMEWFERANTCRSYGAWLVVWSADTINRALLTELAVVTNSSGRFDLCIRMLSLSQHELAMLCKDSAQRA